MPARSSAITWVSAFTPGNARQVVFGSRGAAGPEHDRPGRHRGRLRRVAQRGQRAPRRSPPSRRRRTRRSPAAPGCRRAARAPGRRRRSAAPARPSPPAPAAARPPPAARRACATTAPATARRWRRHRPRCGPAACTASTCSQAPAARHSDAASAIGWIVPVSLLASIRHSSAGASASNARSAARSATPSRSTGSTAAPGAAARTASCSVAPTISRRPGGQPAHRQRVRLGAARGEHQIGRPAAEAARDRLARLLEPPPRRPPGGMHRRRVAHLVERRQHRLAGGGPQRLRCVSVEVGHGPIRARLLTFMTDLCPCSAQKDEAHLTIPL